MEKEVGIAMIAAASKAIKYKNENSGARIDEVITYVMRNLFCRPEAKIGAVASASAAFNFKEKNPRAKDKEVFQFIVGKMPEMIRELELVNQSR
jgi:hypothetical protein